MTAITTTSPRKTGCGCGGGSSSSHGHCTCDSAISPQWPGGVLARPVFFAGQLLTEDDLQQLSQYVVRKSRLHNRYLFGSGVVCGLAVRPSPCDPRSVIVDPGYALDACGNDIVIDIPPPSLDIFRMIQALRANIRKGFDCGDPCVKPKKPAPGKDAETTESPAPTVPQTYELYVRYTEIPSGFVTPYEVDGCGSAGCQASIMEEGYQFELRCPSEHPASPTLASRIAECLKGIDGVKNADTVIKALDLLDQARKVVIKSDTLSVKDGLKSLEDDLKNAIDALTALDKDRPSHVLASDPTFTTSWLRQIHQAQVLTFRARLLDPADAALKPTRDNADLVKKAVDDALVVLTKVSKLDAFTKVLNLRQTELGLATTSTVWPQGTKAETFDKQSAIAGETLTLADVEDATRNLSAVAVDLLRQQRDGLLTLDAGQIKILKRASFPELTQQIARDAIPPIWLAGLDLAGMLFRVVSDCYCDALANPCPSDGDLGILLATIDINIDDCVIISACNQARQSVLTGPAIRYWLAQVNEWFQASRDLCCPSLDAMKTAAGNIATQQKVEETDWKDNASVVSDWPSDRDLAPAPAKASDTVAISAALGRLASFTGRPPASVAGLDLFHLNANDTADPSLRTDLNSLSQQLQPLNGLPDLVRLLNANVGKLTTQEGDLSDTVDALKTTVDGLTSASAKNLFLRWSEKAAMPRADRIQFLTTELKADLTPKGLKQLSQADPKSLEKVVVTELKVFGDLTAKAQAKVSLSNAADLSKLDSVAKLIEFLDVPDRADPDNVKSMNMLWSALGELEFLVNHWPDTKIPDLS